MSRIISGCFQGSYEPGKRHWLKVKKDYLNEGAMADTADLVVLGAFYGKGSNGVKKNQTNPQTFTVSPQNRPVRDIRMSHLF